MRCRLPLLALLLACLLALLPSLALGQSDSQKEQQAQVIQDYFHFRSPDGSRELTADEVKRSLDRKDDGGQSVLNEGVQLAGNAKQLDAARNHRWVDVQGINAHDVLAFEFTSTGVPFVEFKLVDAIEAAGDIAVAFPALREYQDAYAGLKDAFDKSSHVNDAANIIGEFAQQVFTINQNYILDQCYSAGEDDSDGIVDGYLKAQTGMIAYGQSHGLDFVAWAKSQLAQRWALEKNLAAALSDYKTAANADIAGRAVIHISPSGLYVPTTVTLDGSDSVGPYGTTVTSHKWTVDGHDMGRGASISMDYWAIGTHHVSLLVTGYDAHNNPYPLTAETDFTVGAPPILIDKIDSDKFCVSLHTVKNAKIASYAWDFGDGTIISGADKDAVSHTYVDGTKQYSVWLRISMAGYPDVTSQVLPVAFHQNPTDWGAGTFQSDTDWGVSQSPYRVHGTLTIPKGVTLTLEPGVVLQFDANAGLEVYGKLLSKGQATATKRVYLVPAGDNSPPSLTNPGKDNSTQNWYGVLAHAGAQTSVSSVTFRKTATGIWTNEGGLSVSGATFENCNNSATLSGPGPFVFSGNTLKNSGAPAFSPSGGDLTVSGNLFDDGYLGGASVGGTVRAFAHSGNRAASGRAVLRLNGLTLTGDNAWSPDSGEKLAVSGWLQVEKGATLRLAPGLALFFDNYGWGSPEPLAVRGALRTEGAGSGPVTLTYSGDDSPLGGQDNDGGLHGWLGVQVAPGGAADLSGFLVRHAIYGAAAPGSVTGARFELCGTGAVPYGGGALSVSGCSFVHCGNAANSSSGLDGDRLSFFAPDVAFAFTGNTLSDSPFSVSMGGGDLTVSGNLFDDGYLGGASVGGTVRAFAHSGNRAASGRAVLRLNGLTLTGDNAWSPDSGEKLAVSGWLQVEKGATLRLAPGLALFFDNYGWGSPEPLAVRGALRTEGAGSGPVTLTYSGDDSPLGGQDNDGGLHGWLGVQVAPGGAADLSGFLVRHAIYGAAAPGSVTGARFELCGTGAVPYGGGALSVSGCSFVHCGNAANSSSGLDGDRLSFFAPDVAFAFTGNTLSDSPFSVSMGGGDLTVSGNLFDDGYLGGASVGGTVRAFAHSGNRAASGRAVLRLNGLTLTGDNAWSPDSGEKLAVSGWLQVEKGATLRLAPGLALFFDNYGWGSPEPLAVRGALRTEGAGSGPVTLTYSGDDSPLGGQDNDGGLHGWLGVQVAPGGAADLSGFLVRHAIYGAAAETLNANNASFQLCGVAIQISKGGGVLRGCSFTDTQLAIQNVSTTNVDARGSWFGDATGPYNAKSNPQGRGNPVSDYVLFDAAPAKVVLNATATLARVNGQIVATVVLTNSGGIAAANVSVSGAVLGSANPTTKLPLAVGSIAPGGTKTITLVYAGGAAAPGSATRLALTAAYTGGSLSSTIRLTAP